jgi:DNA-binding XRE family transcriptional regulator
MNKLLNLVLALDDDAWQNLLEERRFWKQVDISKGANVCWPWMGCGNGDGYGVARLNKKTIQAHRAAYMLSHNEVLGNKMIVVRHRCDNKLCCNPNHLELGTHADNIQDWQSRIMDQKGEHNYYSKLTELQVKEIRMRYSNGELQKVLAIEFGVNSATINQIVHGWTWKETFIGSTKKRKHSKLTSEQLLSIKDEYDPINMSQNKLAEKYKVSRATIHRILIGDYIL